ncbi:MAG: pyridoxal phosphate-dependent aminotransferase [Flavobacteriaceae bacterium]|nr:pyridoxal phosphate-dependent aminotransferase [Flavobacteriaceae bacterium]
MPHISTKGSTMPESPIRKLVPYAEKAKKRGVGVIHLNIGQPDIKTPQVAMDAIRNNTIDVLAYSRTEGSEAYRLKLAGYYKKHGININSSDIIISTGGSEALSFAMNSIADNGDEIIIPEPFYANYNGFATTAGVKVVPVTSGIETNFALPSISEFEKAINSRTKAILICNPGNPTGYLYTHDEIVQLTALVKKHDLFLIADEVYREFAYDGHVHHSILKEPDMESHAIMVDSVSKRYSMCGARVGCLVSRNKEVIRTALKFAQARLSPPTLGQLASEAALDTEDSYFEAVIQEYQMRRNVLVSALQKIEGVQVTRPKGAFYCIAALPVDDSEAFAQWLLESFEFEGETVMVAPAGGFYSTPGMGANQIRIAYVLKADRLKKAVDILGAALKAYQA